MHLLGDVGRREVDDDPLPGLRTLQMLSRRRPNAEVEQVHHLKTQTGVFWELKELGANL